MQSGMYNIFIDCEYNYWTEWSSCTATCGGGIEIRSRDIKIHDLFGGKECDGNGAEKAECNTQTCPSGKTSYS